MENVIFFHVRTLAYTTSDGLQAVS